MKRHVWIALLLTIIVSFSLVFSGCDTGNGAADGNGAPATVPTVGDTSDMVEAANIGYPPEGTGDEFYTDFEMCTWFIDLFIKLANMYLDADLFDWQGSEGTYTASYAYDGTDITLTLTIVWDSIRSMWHYSFIMDGTVESYEGIETFNNFLVFEMYAKPDGTAGEITFYIFDDPQGYCRITWNKESTYITFTLEIKYEEDILYVTVKETIPYYSTDTYYSESGSYRIQWDNEAPLEGSWGLNPPELS